METRQTKGRLLLRTEGAQLLHFPVLTGSKSSTGVDASITLVSARFEPELPRLGPHLGQATFVPGLGAAGVVAVRGTL